MNLRTEVRSLTIFIIALFLVFSAVSVIAQNVDVDHDESTTLSVTVYGVQLNYRNITQEGTIDEGGHSILGDNQGDVATNVNVTVNFTAVGGIDSVDYINVTAWFDNGTDSNYYEDIGNAPNFRWKLQMDNSTGNPSWSLLFPNTNKEVALNGYEQLYHNDTTQNWTVELRWGDQIKHALPDTGDWAGPPDTQNTWNVNWTFAQPTYRLNTTWQNEYGVYKYVSIVATNDPTGYGTPGSYVEYDNITDMNSNITFSSNDRFNISTQINQTFDNGPAADVSDGTHQIGIENIRVRTNWTDGIGSYVNFNSIGEKLYLNNSGSHPPYYSGNEQHIQTQWSVYIPLGQYADTYKTQITYKIDMDESF